jgi:hypothetical protein
MIVGFARGRPERPLMRLRALQGPRPESQDGHSFRPPRPAFRRPSGTHSRTLAHGSRHEQALPALSLLFRDMSSEPRREPSHVGRPKPSRDPSRPAAFPGLLCPTTHTRSADPLDDGESLRRRVPRPGFDYPLRGVHRRPSQHRGVGASMGFTLQGVPLARDRRSSRSPCPPDVAVHPPSRRRVREAVAFKAFFPRRVRAVTVQPRPHGRRYLLGVFPSRAFPPSVRAPACSHGAGPLVLGRGDVPTRMDLRASRTKWIGLTRFRVASSPGVSHLPTVTTLRTPLRGTGSWFHLTRDIA